MTGVCRDRQDSTGRVRLVALRQNVQPLHWYPQEPLQTLRLETGAEYVAVVSFVLCIFDIT